MRFIDGVRAHLRLIFGSRAFESRIDDEVRFHVEMETERLEREEGLSPGEARRRALVSFGGVDRTKEALREGRGRGVAWVSGLRLDLKLGARMLVKYPVLTGASVLALTVALGLAASWFVFMSNIVRPSLPVPDGDRVVMLRNRDVSAGANRAPTLHDLEAWRDVSSLRELSAAAGAAYTVTTEGGRFGSVEGMRVTPGLLPLTRVQPFLGRTLLPADYEAGAPPVAVLGHAAWRRLFDEDRGAIGRTVRLGGEHATVVGVMPEGFAFPMNEEIWVPLRERALDHPRGEGPALMTFARLAPGATVGEARAELAVIGHRIAAEFPDTHEHIRPTVDRFGRGSDMATPVTVMNVAFLLFLLVVSANVATLFFARTASRESELALRSALGAGRRRLVIQLVAESLVLTSVAAALALVGTHWGMGWGMELFWEVQQTTPPFWFRSGVSASTVVYVGLMALLGALIIGGIPALRATRRELRTRLPQPGAGGSGLRFGVVSTGVIIVQVALCVAFLPIAIMNGLAALPEENGSEFPAEGYLTARLIHSSGQNDEETGALFDDVLRRLAAEPGVAAAARASRIPGMNHGVESVELEGDTTWVVDLRPLGVDPAFFDLVGARIASGRGFTDSDVAGEAGVAIVDASWAEEAFGGRNPIGRRLRYTDLPGKDGAKWHEIVGTVEGMEDAIGPGSPVAMYHPLKPAEMGAVQVYLRTTTPPTSIAPRVVDLVSAVDPGLALLDVQPLDEVWRPVLRSNTFFLWALGVVSAIILLFATIGIYALMSFTVTRRAREIGIRSALGADPRRIVVSIFSRAVGQIGIGILAGATLISLTVFQDPEGIRLVAGVAAAMLAVGLAGCILPARRALRIHPTEALRAE